MKEAAYRADTILNDALYEKYWSDMMTRGLESSDSYMKQAITTICSDALLCGHAVTASQLRLELRITPSHDRQTRAAAAAGTTRDVRC